MVKFKEIMKRRGIATLLVFVFAATLMPVYASNETDEYAEIILGKRLTEYNMHNADDYEFVAETVDGKTGARTNKGNKVYYMYIDIDDKYMYDIPIDTPLDITVEYFDRGKGWFILGYDSHNPDSAYYSGNDIWRASEAVYMDDTKEWKTYTFHLEDMRAANRCGRSDFRIGIWDPAIDFSPEDILFHSIRLERGEYKEPIKYSFDTGVTGNLMAADDELKLYCDLKNKESEKAVNVRVNGTVYDMYGNALEEFEDQFEFLGGQERREEILLNNPKRHDLYYIEGEIEMQYRDVPQRKVAKSFYEQFSVSYIYEKGEGLDSFGVCNQTVSGGRGTPNEVADVIVSLGGSWVRDGVSAANGGQYIDGKWVLPEYKIEAWKKEKEKGVNILGILTGQEPYFRNNIPANEKQVAEFADWCEDTAAQLKGIIDHFEIWNEPNIETFNHTMESPEQYAEVCKAAYPAIKRGNPDAVVIGIDTAGCMFWEVAEWIERVFEAGGYDYMDAVSVHPYEWSGVFRDEKWITEAKALKELMSRYGDVKPIWSTEFGFSSYEGNTGYSRKDQYRNHVRARSYSDAYGLFDKYIMYVLTDRELRTEIEHNWGYVNHWIDPNTPYGAKESFLAMTAYSHFIDDNTEAVNTFYEDRLYVFNFMNKTLGKNVLLLQAADDVPGDKRNVRLGCKSVELYDAYGNHMETLYSDTGEYSFLINCEPQYAVGNFSAFEVKKFSSLITANATTLNGVANDVVTFEFEKHTNKKMYINVEDTVEVLENNGFKGNKAQVKIRVPNLIDKEISFDISVYDESGKAYYCDEHTINITVPASVTFTTETSAALNSNIWQIRAVVTNLANDISISGTLSIDRPESIASKNIKREFKNLKPGKSVTFLYKLPETVSKAIIEMEANLALESGYTKEFVQKLDFTLAAYAKDKPVIDGTIKNGEWGNNWVGASERKDVQQIDDWAGPEDVSFNGALMWDEEYCYIAATIVDDIHYIQAEGGAEKLWSVDSLQFAFDDRDPLNPAEHQRYAKFGFGDVPGEGPVLWRYDVLYELPIGRMENEKIQTAVKRHNNYTVYECRIPWDEIFRKDYELNPDGVMRFSILANDNDGTGRGWIEYSSGIGRNFSVFTFSNVTFEKNKN